MEMTSAPVIERLHERRPIIQREGTHPWENAVTFNPACVLVTNPDELRSVISALPFDHTTKETLLSHSALCFLLYRAQGKKTAEHDYTRSSLGLAVLSTELRLLARHTKPVMLPDQEYDDLGVED